MHACHGCWRWVGRHRQLDVGIASSVECIEHANSGGRSLCRRGRTPSPRVLRADDFNLVLRSRRWAALTASAYCCSHRFMPSKTPFSQAAALAAARSIARRTARPAARAAAHAAARAAARAAHFHPSPKHAVMPGLLLAKMIKFRLIASKKANFFRLRRPRFPPPIWPFT